MTSPQYTLGIDVGNTNVKCVAVSAERGVIGAVSIPTSEARDAVSRQLDMERLWLLVCRAISALLGEVAQALPRTKPSGIAVSSAGSESVVIDDSGAVIPTPLGGSSAGELYRRYTEAPGPSEFFRTTGYPLEPNLALFEIARLRERSPSDFDRVSAILSISGYLSFRLSGERAFEPSIVGSFGVRDIASGQISSGLVAGIPLTGSEFGRAVATGGSIGEVTGTAALQSGVPAGVPVFSGAHDYLSSAFAVTPWMGRAVLDVLGTYEMVATLHRQPKIEADSPWRHFVDIDATGQRFSYTIEALSGGRMHQFRQRTPRAVRALQNSGHGHLDSPSGTGHAPHLPLYLPGSLTGSEIGSFVGLDSRHRPDQILDGVFLGLTFLTLGAFREQQRVSSGLESVCAVGGMSTRGSWMQTKADVLGMPVVVPHVSEATATGAALLAGVGCGLFNGYEQAASALAGSSVSVYEPDPLRHAQLTELYESRFQPRATERST